MMTNKRKTTAKLFGRYLDEDNYEAVKALITENCKYEIGAQTIYGKDDIVNLYEENMKEGKKKLDELIWGKSDVKQLNEKEYEVYFSDYLKHKGIEHNYKCKQKLSINDNGLIEQIVHIELANEKELLQAFYKKVGLR